MQVCYGDCSPGCAYVKDGKCGLSDCYRLVEINPREASIIFQALIDYGNFYENKAKQSEFVGIQKRFDNYAKEIYSLLSKFEHIAKNEPKKE